MWPLPPSDAAWVFCRAGLESDAAAELTDRAGGAGIAGWCRTGDGWVEFHPVRAADLATLAAAVPFDRLVFPRQWFARFATCTALPPADRISPLVEAVRAAAPPVPLGGLRLEYPDTDAGRPLARLARGLRTPLQRGLADAGFAMEGGRAVLHCVLLDGATAVLGLSDPANASPWPLGIPRLRAHRRAPSRSVLKLDEAFGRFLADAERAAWLRPGRTAVDLGAAPGGWTWLLRRHGLEVTAIDNGPLAAELGDDPDVRHQAADGFRFRPRGPVDWLVCDMVEQPHRVAELAAAWFERGDCRHAIVNLKLPMKKRWAAVAGHLETVGAALPPEGRLRAGQLYHDREEVTLFATRAPLTR